jgi:phosphoribosylanthranilate isomerase
MTHVKICGLTNAEDAVMAAGAGADLLGFIFYPPSLRSVTPESALRIVEAVRRAHVSVRFVGVFVDEEPGTVQQIVAHCGLDYAQLHGAESPEMVDILMDGGLKIIKAFRIRDETTLSEIERYGATAYLLDTYVLGQPGGTGHTFEWRLAVQARANGPILLAGGLTPDNVAQAVRTVGPWGVDVASGVEAAPAHKDHDKVRRFIAAVQAVKARGVE